jgi:hypothetical protein
MDADFLNNWKNNDSYFKALASFAKLSMLFSESEVPYIDYRLTENIFCKFFNAINDARSCTAYDARIGDLGIGIKTFILKKGSSTEKIAEFNKLKNELDGVQGIDLAKKLGKFRNERILLAQRLYGVKEGTYHIIGRDKGSLKIFNTGYDFIDIDKIKLVTNKSSSFCFKEGDNEYFFNRSKSVLLKRFVVPSSDVQSIPVEILADPLSLLLKFIEEQREFISEKQILKKGRDYVILPLYSTKSRIPTVPEKSGLNQWNADGRIRDPNEVYIPIPHKIHEKFHGFFPKREEHFSLELPNGKSLSVKVCQDNEKALMSDPNADLGMWILRDVLKKREGELLTMEDLNRYGVDSVRIINNNKEDSSGRKIYSIEFTASEYESYSDFIGD